MKLIPVINKGPLSLLDEKKKDLEYWLQMPPEYRIAAVTFIISQSLAAGQKMDKTFVVKRKMKA